jgi:hypothetical protein
MSEGKQLEINDALQKCVAEVLEQAEDDGLWFIAETAPEAYLQEHLRRLHKLIEEAWELV